MPQMGFSTIAAGMIAVVAVLGITVYFMFFQMPFQVGREQSNSPDNLIPDEHIPSDLSTGGSSGTSGSSSTAVSLAMERECAELGISKENCNEANILAKKSIIPTSAGKDSIRVTNGQSWTGPDPNNAITAFAIQNTGTTELTLTEIKFRGMPVPVADWYSCKSCATAENLQTALVADFTPITVTIGKHDYYLANNVQVTLAKGEAAVVYLTNAGNIQRVDAGNTFALEVTAGQATSVVQLSIMAIGFDPSQSPDQDYFTISNLHSWVSSETKGTTAFVMQNTGTRQFTVTEIFIGNTPISNSSWYHCISCVSPTIIETQLPLDYTENIVTLGGKGITMQSGPISLEPDQIAIVYLDKAGGIDVTDGGKIVQLKIHAGNAMITNPVTILLHD